MELTRFRYTSNTVFDSFPWPQSLSAQAIKSVAKASLDLRHLRNQLQDSHNLSLREIYRSLELPGESPLKDAHEKLDAAVRQAYGMSKDADPLQFLLSLNES